MLGYNSERNYYRELSYHLFLKKLCIFLIILKIISNEGCNSMCDIWFFFLKNITNLFIFSYSISFLHQSNRTSQQVLPSAPIIAVWFRVTSPVSFPPVTPVLKKAPPALPFPQGSLQTKHPELGSGFRLAMMEKVGNSPPSIYIHLF